MSTLPRARPIWRRGIALWLPPALLVVANLVALAVYPLRFAGRTQVTAEEIAQASAELSELRQERLDLEGETQSIDSARLAVNDLYQGRLSTESARLTRVIAEVKDLATRAGLRPTTIAYPSQPIEELGLVSRSFVFGVEGTYTDLRKFINLLELSDTFLVLDQVGLSGSVGAGRLSIQLSLSTLFAADPEPPLPVSS